MMNKVKFDGDRPNHIPVLLNEAITYLQIKAEGIYVDCTLGRGGHSEVILKKLTTGKLYAFDQDEAAIKASAERLKKYHDKLVLIKSNFINLKTELAKLNVHYVDGILYDLGLSSPQIDESTRGFSYMQDAKLDMRMDQSQKLTTYDIVNNYPYSALKKIIKDYGEEQYAAKIAKQIVKVRQQQPITTTTELVALIKMSLPFKVLNKPHHPAKKTFQALRIAVNDELNVLEQSLVQALTLLKPKANIVVISFHSLEDRIVKTTFQKVTTDPDKSFFDQLPISSPWKPSYEIITKKPIIPTTTEIISNPRSKSAKIRVIKKL